MPKPTTKEPGPVNPDSDPGRPKCWCRWEDIMPGQVCRKPLYEGCYNRNPLCDEHRTEFRRLIMGRP